MSDSLEKFKLYYEDLEICKVSKNRVVLKTKKTTKPTVPKKTVTLKKRVEDLQKYVRVNFNNIKKKLNKQPKKVKKLTKVEQKALAEQKKRAILGIGLLFVVVSIAYSTYITRTFVNSDASLVALAPQVIFAVHTLIKAFSKIYK